MQAHILSQPMISLKGKEKIVNLVMLHIKFKGKKNRS